VFLDDFPAFLANRLPFPDILALDARSCDSFFDSQATDFRRFSVLCELFDGPLRYFPCLVLDSFHAGGVRMSLEAICLLSLFFLARTSPLGGTYALTVLHCGGCPSYVFSTGPGSFEAACLSLIGTCAGTSPFPSISRRHRTSVYGFDNVSDFASRYVPHDSLSFSCL